MIADEVQSGLARTGRTFACEHDDVVPDIYVLGKDIDPSLMTGYELCHRMAERGVLAKDAHDSTIRLAPPLVASDDDIAFMVDVIDASLASVH